MDKIAIIALNTFKEAVRNRVLYILLAFAILLLLSAGVISDLSVASPQDTIRALGLTAINFFSVLIAIFIGVGLVYNEIDKRTIYTIISKPIDRTHFILGKYFGLLLTIFINVLIMTVFFFFAIHFQQALSLDASSAYFREAFENSGGMPISKMTVAWYYISAFFASIGKAMAGAIGLYRPELTKDLWTVIGMNCFELAIITAFAILFSTFSTPTLSSFLTVMTFLMGRGNEDLIRYIEQMNANYSKSPDFAIALKIHLASGAALIAPNLNIFNLTSDAIYADQIKLYWADFLYGCCYPAAILTLAALIFRRRNFK